MPLSHCVELSAGEQARLLDIARRSIVQGLDAGRELVIGAQGLDGNLGINSAVFITLTQAGRLCGCVGSLQPVEPLARAVASAAFNAAFRDRRFAPLRGDEIERVRIEASVLSPMQTIEAGVRQDLLDALQPGIDGLLLEDRGHRATFLPKVWEKIPAPNDFLEQLLVKAGLPAEHWSGTMRCQRYQTLNFAES